MLSETELLQQQELVSQKFYRQYLVLILMEKEQKNVILLLKN